MACDNGSDVLARRSDSEMDIGVEVGDESPGGGGLDDESVETLPESDDETVVEVLTDLSSSS